MVIVIVVLIVSLYLLAIAIALPLDFYLNVYASLIYSWAAPIFLIWYAIDPASFDLAYLSH